MAEETNDFLPLISSIPGPRGAQGPQGPSGAGASPPPNPWATTTDSFVVPAVGGSVQISLDNPALFSVGQTIFIATVGYFYVTAFVSGGPALDMAVQFVDEGKIASPGATITAGKKISPAGPSAVGSFLTAELDDLGNRIAVLESTPLGNRNYYSSSAPGASGLRVGDIWFDTNDGYKMYRWDGSGWALANRVVELPDFGTGIRPIVKVAELPSSGYADGDFVWLETDGKLYRRVGGSWTKAIATGDLVGTIDGTMIVDGTLVAQKLAANSVTADKVGANQIITSAANIGAAVINDSHIANLSAGKITAGDIQTVNLGYLGRIFHPSYPANKFRSVDFGTSFGDGKVFAAGNCLSGGYGHATPVTAYGPGNVGWTSGGVTACPDSDNKVRVQIQGRLIGYTGAVLIYGQINNATPFALAARTSSDSGNATIDCTRVLTGVAATDIVKIYVAPASADGTITPATCRFEVDATFFNW